MKVTAIEYPTPLERCDPLNDNIDVLVTLENGHTYCITVGTVEWLRMDIQKNGKKYQLPCAPSLIVAELRKDIIAEAVQDYACGDAYWLRVLSLSVGDRLPE